MPKLTLDDVSLQGKRVLIRVDFNVPLSHPDDSNRAVVADDTRIRAALPTIRHVLDQGGKAVLISHLGRPGGKPDPGLSLAAVADHLDTLLDERVRFSSNTTGDAVEEAIDGMGNGCVILLENTRFDPGEKSNSNDFADALAALADVYVNDAFGAAHRAHASTAGVAARVTPAVMGRLMEREVDVLTRVRDEPNPPLVAILGGAKVSDKMGTVRRLAQNAEHILIGGAMAYTFMKAQGQKVGDSMVEEDRLNQADELADEASTILHLPTDHVHAASFEQTEADGVSTGAIPDGHLGLDIGPATVKAYTDLIAEANTIIWNGPMGVFEKEAFAQGTLAIADAVAEATDNGAFSVVGGGDSVSALNQSGQADRISHVSTGGGAMLTLLEGAALPGLEALTNAE